MAITYSIDGGVDAAKFDINATTGQVTFKTAPDFENPSDANKDNVYEVTVKATDSGGASTTQNLKVTVTDISENAPPQITSAAVATVAENTKSVIVVTAIDPDGGTPPTEPPPTGTEVDGSSGAPTGTAQFAGALNGLAHRPPWKVAGVDYRVGVNTGITLKNPGTISMSGVSVTASSKRVSVSGAGVKLDGYDFRSSSAGGPWTVVVTGSNVTITNCLFADIVLDQRNAKGAPGSTIRYCEFDQSGLTTRSGFQMEYHNQRGIHILEYCYIHDSVNDSIGLGDGYITDNFVDKLQWRYNVFANSSQAPGADHADWIQIYAPGIELLDFTYNFGIQNKASSNGTQGWMFDNCKTGQASWNTMAKQGSGALSCFVTCWGDHRYPPVTSVVFQHNYVQHNGSLFQYPGAQNYADFHDNINMVTGGDALT